MPIHHLKTKAEKNSITAYLSNITQHGPATEGRGGETSGEYKNKVATGLKQYFWNPVLQTVHHVHRISIKKKLTFRLPLENQLYTKVYVDRKYALSCCLPCDPSSIITYHIHFLRNYTITS
jgi:hypothetical protein